MKHLSLESGQMDRKLSGIPAKQNAVKLNLEDILVTLDECFAECLLCFSCGYRSQMHKCSHCDKVLCDTCGRAYLKMQLADSSKWPIACCYSGCKKSYSEDTLFAMGGFNESQLFLAYYNYLNRIVENPVICPHCKEMYDRNDVAAAQQRCYACKKDFCGKCLTAWHVGLTCEQYKANLLKERDDLMKNLGGVICPGCSNGVLKKKMCNHITCLCGVEFCYLCAARFDKMHEGLCKPGCKCVQAHGWSNEKHPYFTEGDLLGE